MRALKIWSYIVVALACTAAQAATETNLDKRLVGLIEKDYADKAIALINSTDRNSPGIMPATLHLMFKEPDMDAATFYRTHLDWIFPDSAKITPVIPQLLLK